ncbi:unnamed protein product [Moneuplotes crassus]|uniref:Uncharacterized protein n=1 Tax=Euplotes crassus TaxID=5936 RepID=A0AAD2D6W0_EUPCR|nr:unnamed protein product [Moneuplotes crassus]
MLTRFKLPCSILNMTFMKEHASCCKDQYVNMKPIIQTLVEKKYSCSSLLQKRLDSKLAKRSKIRMNLLSKSPKQSKKAHKRSVVNIKIIDESQKDSNPLKKKPSIQVMNLRIRKSPRTKSRNSLSSSKNFREIDKPKYKPKKKSSRDKQRIYSATRDAYGYNPYPKMKKSNSSGSSNAYTLPQSAKMNQEMTKTFYRTNLSSSSAKKSEVHFMKGKFHSRRQTRYDTLSPQKLRPNSGFLIKRKNSNKTDPAIETEFDREIMKFLDTL